MEKIYEIAYKILKYSIENWKFRPSPEEFGESIVFNINLLYGLKNNLINYAELKTIKEIYNDSTIGNSDASNLILEIDTVCNCNIENIIKEN